MIRAGSLFFVILLSTIIGVISVFLLLIYYYQSNQLIEYNHSKTVSINAKSGINLVFAWKDNHPLKLDTTIDLFGKGKDSVRIRIHNWGLYSIGIVKAIDKKWQDQKIFLYGSALPSSMDAALYLSDLDRPLTISGATEIRGNAIVPASSIRSGYLEGKSYGHDTLVYGKQLKSSRHLPPVQETWLNPYFTILFRKDSSIIKKHPYPYQFTADLISRSFLDSTLWIVSKKSISLENMHLTGNICIYSSKEITVDSTTNLDQVILIAPSIFIKGHFNGSLQAFAADSLKTGNNCNFYYPSALILLKDSINKEQPTLQLGKESQLKGLILSYCKKQDINLTSIYIGKSSSIEGVIYCNGYLQFSGKLSGELLTDHFLYKSSSTIYENYLIDASLNRAKLNSHYLCSGLFSNSFSQNNLIEWLK